MSFFSSISKVADSALDFACGPMDSLAKMLPGPLGDLAKVGMGVMTGNPLLAVSGAVGLMKDGKFGSGPATEHIPSKASGGTSPGYAPPASSQGCGAQGPVRENSNSHLDPNFASYAHALEVLDQNWLTFDSAAGARDQFLRRSDLTAISDNPNASELLKGAARFFLQHPEYFNRLEMAAGVGGKDGIVGWGDVKAARNNAQAELNTYGVRPPQGGGCGAGGLDSVLNNPTLSIDERMMMVLEGAYQGIEKQMDGLIREIGEAQNSEKKGDGKSDKSGKAGKSVEMLQQELQRLSERRSQMFTLMSTLSQKTNEMAKLALQNMGRA